VAELGGPLILAAGTLAAARSTLRRCDAELRRWYDAHQGRKVMA
jgi:hypothetical protein